MTQPLGSSFVERLAASAWWTRSFRRRILTATIAGGLIALLLGVLIFGIALYRIFTVSAQQGARNQASDVANDLASSTATVNLNQILVNAQQGSSIIQVLDTNGTVLAVVGQAISQTPISTMRPTPGQYLADPSPRTVTGDLDVPYAVVARGVSTSSGDRIVLVAEPMSLELRTVRITIILLAAGGVLVICILLSYLTSVLNRALGRVEQIRSEVASMQGHHPGARVQVPKGEDEFARLARTMNSMLTRLDDADAAQRRFVSNASHELRSPLATVRAVVETHPDGLTPDATRLVAAETLRMQQLVEDLLTLARFDDAGVNIRPTDVDVDELLLDEVRRVRSMNRVGVTASVQPVRIRADQGRVAQAIRNLVDNAMRHATGQLRLSCHIEEAEGAHWAVIDVDNDGEPVPVDQRTAVFERFARLDAARARDSGGSGLGLAIVATLVEAHGGSASTGETPEGWCRFELRLPAPEPDPLLEAEEIPEDELGDEPPKDETLDEPEAPGAHSA